MPTAIWKSRLRPGSAHWDLELAVEVRQCPLGSGARSGGPADLDCEEEAAGEEAEEAEVEAEEAEEENSSDKI